MSLLQRLSENVVLRDLSKENNALLEKWTKVGLLEGLKSEIDRKNMAVLLENQTKRLIKEVSSMAGGDVEGFAAVAFPIVRRVFGGLLANDIVSVQSMSLPSGLIFFLDFSYTNDRLAAHKAGESIYGGGVVGQQLTGGVSLSIENSEKSFYALNNGYASPTGSVALSVVHEAGAGALNLTVVASGTVGGTWTAGIDGASTNEYTALGDQLVRYDPDLSGSSAVALSFPLSTFTAAQLNVRDYVTISLTDGGETGNYEKTQVRRLTRTDPVSGSNLIMVLAASASANTTNALSASAVFIDGSKFAINDNFTTGGGLGSIVGTDLWGLEQADNAESATAGIIPEIDIKVDSVAVTAITKKLKAKWTPELGQDLNAYHNLDAEVELTGILSEEIALEIDREIIEDLVKHATASTYYWSRHPGYFVNRETGLASHSTTSPPDFTGNVSEWYETLIETINDVSAQIHRKTLRGGANFLLTSPEVANIIEMTNGFRGTVTHDDTKGSAGAVKTGEISKKFDIYVDPYFPRNLILVGS